MSISANRVSLVMPGLLGPQQQYPLLESQERPNVKNLTTLLSRATYSDHNNDDWLRIAFDLLLPNSEQTKIPFASISASYDQLTCTDAWCLRIDPVFLRVDMDSAIMLAADELQLTEQEANEIAESINQHLKDDGIRIQITHPHRWYLLFDTSPEITTTPLHQVMRKDVHSFLPQGNKHQYWRSLLNELQMLLYTHPVNQQRDKRGLAPVNSVWLWGEGKLPEKKKMNWDKIYTDEPLIEILAKFFEIPCYELNQFQDTLHQPSDDKENILLVTTALEEYVHNQDIFAWINALQQLDSSLFQDIRDAFKMKRLQQCELYPGNNSVYHVSLKQSRKWWKFNKPMTHFLST